MRRLVETTAGRLELEVHKPKVGGLSVGVTLFASDGWESAHDVWGENFAEGQTLAQAIEKTAGLSQEDAERIAMDTLRQWRDHGGEEPDPDETKILAYVGGTFGLAALGLAGLVALGVWLATRVL